MAFGKPDMCNIIDTQDPDFQNPGPVIMCSVIAGERLGSWPLQSISQNRHSARFREIPQNKRRGTLQRDAAVFISFFCRTGVLLFLLNAAQVAIDARLRAGESLGHHGDGTLKHEDALLVQQPDDFYPFCLC